MKLFLQVIEARGLVALDLNRLSDPYVRLKLGKQRAKTKVVKKSSKPWWEEEFFFQVEDLGEELTVSVMYEDKCFNGDFIGQVKLPLSMVLDAENHSLGTAWYQLQSKSKKAKNRECGEIRLAMSLSQKNSCDGTPPWSSWVDLTSNSDKSSELKREIPSVESSSKMDSYAVSEDEEVNLDIEEKLRGQSLRERMSKIFSRKNVSISTSSSKDSDITEINQEKPLNLEPDETLLPDNFSESLKFLKSKEQGSEVPENLPGGVLLDKHYAISPAVLNSLIFSPDSKLLQSLADVQGTTDLCMEPWKFENGGESLKRVLTYIKAATKLVKAVKATESQTYLKVDDRNYAVLASVSTPDVPFGSSFRCEVLYCIMPGPQLPSEEQSSHLVISWRINFLQSTMMKGMIENGAKQGLKENFVQFAEVLSLNAKTLDLKDAGSRKEQILSSMETEPESEWKLVCRIFGNFTIISFILAVLCVTVHILLANRSSIQGLEFIGLDLPDSIEEVMVCGVLFLQGEHALKRIGHFLQARRLRGNDHGVRAEGDGWLLTIALIEGINFAAADSSGYSDPYVVFTCNGKRKTSSIKFQTLDPQWNEIFEFDAMNDPPSTMDIKVFDFDGPFNEAVALGNAEVNFVKNNLSELEDVWIALEGTLAQACQSKLHLRIFLSNTRGDRVVSDYLTKMEKEVGRKINLRSPQTNSAFQKLFGLPPEEFLINDFTCHLKRKMPLQGRLFLSPRITGFYTNLFGHKTKFFFLWEDIEDIQVIPPSLKSMGSPSLLIILRCGRCLDSRHWAKSVDPDGKLKFHFQSFVSFNVANRLIMALWKARSLSPEQKMKIAEEESEDNNLQSEESGSFFTIEDAKMSEVFSSVVPVPMKSLLEMFGGGCLEQKLMEKVGCVDYSFTPWESVRLNVHQRQIHYKFDKNISRYGGEVTSTQQRSHLHDKNECMIEEVMTLQGVLLGDYFTVLLL
ncbi:C2 and GRAM domain-containing protein At1g03370-like isoform X2 [Phalaenopsis equestris]|uniref:C2 and GRAM domain-containing protein At1g03370-like isoform X2 n=1 Tax=Phalaenopsis equestris TaxID=78828 RepID=UPI0009E654C0|nr:C2 and GRAM domain-containing protein At1g03370-like isoform X2 [Phalaenopsis equestris]